MKYNGFNIRLLIAFAVLLAGTVISELFIRENRPVSCAGEMKEAVKLTEEWFSLIGQFKNEAGVVSDALSNVKYSYLIGDEWSDITTTLGSLDSKETATNPDFSALMVRLISEAGIKKGDRVGLILSGSFPSLGISTLAALQTMGIEAVVMSSLGASTYGANQPGATWLDFESTLATKGGLAYHSSVVSIGAGRDSGNGLPEEGIIDIKNAARRNNVELFIPESLRESIDMRYNLLMEAGIGLLINIGGNQSALGNCAHSTIIPNGLNESVKSCDDYERGLIYRLNESGIPFINLLNIKELAGQYGIAVSPGIDYPESINLYTVSRTNKPVLGLILLIGFIPLWFLRKRSEGSNK